MRDVVINSGYLFFMLYSIKQKILKNIFRCTIQNSVISNGTYIQSNASLDRCYTGPNSVVETNAKYIEEIFL